MTTQQLLDVQTLRLAYIAVKFQRMQADIGNLWRHDLMVRDDVVAAEETLRTLLETTKFEEDLESRGGPKPLSY